MMARKQELDWDRVRLFVEAVQIVRSGLRSRSAQWVFADRLAEELAKGFD